MNAKSIVNGGCILNAPRLARAMPTALRGHVDAAHASMATPSSGHGTPGPVGNAVRINSWRIAGLIAAWLFTANGCSPEAQRYIRFPNFAHPGPAGTQRAEAIYHDPYPLNDVGPEVVGGRPLAYQQSLNEVDRARLQRPGQMLRPVPVPGSAVTAPPVASSPYAVAPTQPAVPLATTPPPIVTSPVPAVAPAPPPAAFGTPVVPVVTTPAAPPANTNSFPPQQRAPY